MLTKECGQTNTFISIILMTKITLDMWMWGPFYNKPGVIVNWENVWKNKYVQMYKVSREVYFNENLNEIKNWDLIKGHSKRANVIFSDSEN